MSVVEELSLAHGSPPGEVDAEQAVLGSILLRGAPALAEALDEGLGKDSFYSPRYSALFGLFMQLEQAGYPLDAVSVYARASQDPSLHVDAALLHELAHNVPTPTNVSHYALIVLERSQRRRIVEVLQRGLNQACGGAPVEGVLDSLEAGLLAVSQDRNPQWQAAGDGFEEYLQGLQDISNGNTPAALQTGYTELDQVLGGGLRPGQMVVVAARPSVGKSLVAVGWAWHVAVRLGQGVGFLSYEMSKDELTARFLSLSTGVPLSKISDPKLLSDPEWEKLLEMKGTLEEAPLWVDDSGSPTLSSIRSRARALARRHGLSMLIVDYLQLIPSEGGRFENRQVEVQSLSRGLKGLATELRIPVVALSQLNRNSEHRVDRRPALADLRESGAVENDADVVVLLHRPDLTAPSGDSTRGEVELIVAKNRQGPRATVSMAAQPHKARFVDMPQAVPSGSVLASPW